MQRTEMIALLSQAQAALDTLVLQGTVQWRQGMTCANNITRVKQALQNATIKEEKTDEHGVQENQ